METTCPQCGAAVAFRAPLPVAVCGYCRSTLVRDGGDATLAGTAATVPEDVSPLAVGARGQDGARGFEVVGRVRWAWADGGWNEWAILFDDGGAGWLGEAAGRFMLLAEAAVGEGKVVRQLRSGALVTTRMHQQLGGIDYRVTDVRAVTCVASEGALPSPAPAGLGMTSVDLGAADGRCASIQREGDAVRAYAGRYATLAELRPTGLRTLDGWALPVWAASGGAA